MEQSKLFFTEFQAVDIKTGELGKWSGPHVQGNSKEDAQEKANDTHGYLRVLGEVSQAEFDDAQGGNLEGNAAASPAEE